MQILGLPEGAKSSYQLSVNIHRAELMKNRIQVEMNSYLTVMFAGTMSKSKLIRSSYDPEYKDKLLIPVYQPTMAHEIEIRFLITQRYTSDLIIDKICVPYAPIQTDPKSHF